MKHCEMCRCPTCEIRNLQSKVQTLYNVLLERDGTIYKLRKDNAELQAKNTDLWTELTTACQKTAKDFRADELQAENRRLEKENAELLERAHYAVVASDLSVERAEQAEAVLLHLYELIASPECDYYGPGLSDIAPEHRATIERLQEQSNEK